MSGFVRLVYVGLGGALAASALIGAVVWKVAPHTVYATRYSDEAFGSIREGDDVERVIAVLGEPLSRHETAGSTMTFYYSKPAWPKATYVMVMVWFDGAGHVVGREKRDFMD